MKIENDTGMDFDVSNTTSELVVNPRPDFSNKDYIECRKTLNSLTKQQICELSLEQFGVELDIRTEKKILISEFLRNQEELNKSDQGI